MQDSVDSCLFVGLKNITYEKRGSYEGFIRGELYFLDQSTLHFREFIDTETEVNRLMYTYHYSDSFGNLIFRYDNTGHHKKLGLSTYPNHKHNGSETNVVESKVPTLEEVLHEIERSIRLF